jgi:hypothetical protein
MSASPGAASKRIVWTILALSFITLVFGCASVPLASKEEETQALGFRAEADHAGLYVCRKSEYNGSGLLTQIVLDGKMKGSLKAGTFFYFSVSPGSHSLAYISADSQRNLSLDVDAGKNYYVELSPRVEDIGFWKFRFLLADEAHAQATIRKCRLAEAFRF